MAFINSFSKNEVVPNIISLTPQSIPYYFINKIDDMNVIIGQQQLEHMNQTVSSGKHLGTDITKKQKLNSWNEKERCRKICLAMSRVVSISKQALTISNGLKCLLSIKYLIN